MAGNKGAVAIRLEIDDTSCCFVTAHLAAGFANYEERNRDYHTISQGLRFQRNRSIDDHDTVIWLGDFNYRIGLSFDKARNFAKADDYGRLYENDQVFATYSVECAFAEPMLAQSPDGGRLDLSALLRGEDTVSTNLQIRYWK